MPIASGFDHVATLTPDLDRLVDFYCKVFDGTISFEMQREGDHPRMTIVRLGSRAALNIFEVPAEEIIGERRRQGGRGAIDHFGIAVESRADLDQMRDRLVAYGADIGEIQVLGDEWSLFFRDPDGMELEVLAPGAVQG
jgi:catechol 2,3-dioxygenase-like lactoylglutathione lyase family enzyme